MMKQTTTKKLFLSLATAFLGLYQVSLAQVPSYQWVNQAYSSQSFSNPVYNDGIAVDVHGNSYITGTFKTKALFGTAPDTLSLTEQSTGSNDAGDIYLAKYDNTGKIAWVRSLNNRQHNVGLLAAGYQLVDVDAADNIYVSGAFYDSLSAGSTTLATTSNNHYCSFLAKYDINGNLLWLQKVGTGEIWAEALSVDAGGNSFLTGYVNGTSTSAASVGGFSTNLPSQFFVAKFNSGGSVVWGKGNTGYICAGTALKAQGATLFLTGQGQQGVVFGTDTVKNTAGNSNYVFFVTKMDTAGNYIWTRGNSAYDSHSESHGSAITADNTGNCYVAGDYAALFKLGSFNFPAGSNVTQRNAFLAKYDASGTVQSVNTFTCTSGQNNFAQALCFDHNKIIMTGITPGATNFGSATLAYSGSYVAVFNAAVTNSSVAYISGTNFGSASTDYNYGLKTDTTGAIYVSGRFSHSETFGSLTDANASYMPAAYLGKFGVVTGIGSYDLREKNLLVYPNPASERISVDCGDNGNGCAIEITDAMGNVIYAGVTKNTKIILSCEGWARGVYFVRCTGEAGLRVARIVVQ